MVSAAREEILARLRQFASAGETLAVAPPIESPCTTTWSERAARFTASAESAAATVARVNAIADVADAVAGYLRERGLAPEVHLSAGAPAFAPGAADDLHCTDAPLRADGDTLVTGCFASLAEEGVVVLASGPAHAAEATFLAATHIVVVEADRLLDSMDSLWPRLRALPDQPRMLNIVRGPSRTADLGVPSRLGAHGPLRVHVILVAGDD
jgi:L-lactate dehydrogenase complex protein LldG